jgi:hypothetical protein
MRIRNAVLSAACVVASRGADAQGLAFPAAWAGKWSGTLSTIAPPDSERNRIPITLEIAPESTGSAYRWTTVFNADTVRGLRPYRLLVEDAAKGLFATDEGNGVLLDETYIGGVLTSVFKVQTRVLESRYVVRGDTLTHELTWWESAPTRTVRGAGANAEGGVEITSYRVLGMQRSVMTRRR